MSTHRQILIATSAGADTGPAPSLGTTRNDCERERKDLTGPALQLVYRKDEACDRSDSINERGTVAKSKGWTLTRQSFDKFLAHLNADRDLAGEKYEYLRIKLTDYFDRRHCLTPTELADRTMDVVAGKIWEGLELKGDDLCRYSFGVARNILKEYWGRAQRSPLSLEQLPPSEHPFEDPREESQRRLEEQASDEQLEALDKCLQELPEQTREMIV